jgi:alpha-galactosidase
VYAKDIEDELAIASKLGMRVAILDDGWHTDDITRDYARCGDWKVAPRRFPDMKAHVGRAHELGMKYMMWYSVPFVGLKSGAIEQFRGKTIGERLVAGVLDPRFPEVRRFLVGIFESAMRDYGLDGLKLDFIDSFAIRGEDPAVADNYAGRDVKSVPVAVNMLMTEIHDAIVTVKPDALVEFRQSYIGAAIRQYGNMLRVGDCPGDMRRNRVAIAILRMTSGSTAVHSDMLEWNLSVTAEEAALFVLNSIFGVVQYSIMLRRAPESHLRMMAHWIGFSREHRNALLKGRFTPRHAALMFPLIEAEDDSERIVAVYEEGRVADCGDAGKTTYVLNATAATRVTLRIGAPASVEVFDTFGTKTGTMSVTPGLADIACPAAGFLRLSF